MTRFYFIAALAGFTAFAFGQEEPLPKAENILDRYVEVTGGKAAYEKRKNELSTGTLEFKAQGLKGSVISYSAEPAQEYLIIDIEGVGKIESGMNNGVVWEKSAILGPRIKSGQERAQSLRDGAFNPYLHWRELYPKAETTGTEIVDGEVCYKVVLTPPTGSAETRYFQKKSGLAVKMTTIGVSQMGEVPLEVLSGDYKNFGGVSVPTRITQKTGGQEFVITLQDVKTNQSMPPDRFDPPAEVKALLNKAADKK
jgi:zinc protease